MGLNTRIDPSAAKSIRSADSYRGSAARSLEEAFGEPLTLLTGARALEPRILLDAAGFATATALVDPDDGASGQGYDFSWMPDIAPDISSEADTAANEIAFVDGGLADLDTLIAGLPEGVTVVILDPQRDGVAQIAQYLADMRGVEALHIVSHGAAGNLQIGTAQLNANTIAGEFADELAAIGAALSANADILVYGCDFAAGDAGAAAVAALAAATGADVAASDDATGAAALGGDWVLETVAGAVEAGAIAALDYNDTLAAANSGAWTISGSTATNTTSGITTTVTFTPNSANSVFGSIANGAFNTIAAFSNAADGDPSLSFVYTWDTSPEAITGIPQPQASTDGGLGTITITFSQAVTNPVINLDRLGGFSLFDPNTSVPGDENAISNSALWTVTTPGATLTELTGTSHFDVTATTIQRTPDQNVATTGGSSESGFNSFTNTAAGSVRVNGTFTTITFQLSGVGVEGGGADGIELGFILDPIPIIDLNSAATVADVSRDFATTFTENGAAVNVASATLADASDNGENDLTALTIATSGIADGAAEIVRVNGLGFPLDTSSTQTTTVSGTTLSIAYTAGAGFTITRSGGGVVPQTVFDTLVRGITYENTDDTPTTGARTLAFQLTDATGQPSNPAVSTITVVAANDPPVAVDDGPVTVIAGQTVNIAVLDNDNDVDGGALSVIGIVDPANPLVTIPIAVGTPVTLASGTTVTLLADGTLDVVMAPGSSDNDSFEYQVSDGNGGTGTAAVTLARDTDGDGVANAVDIDDDNDGVIDIDEGFVETRTLLGYTLNGTVPDALQSAYHSTLIQTVGDWLIAGEGLDGSGGNQLTLTYMSDLYTYPAGSEPLLVTVGGTSSVVALFDNGQFYYAGSRDNSTIGNLLADGSVTAGESWAVTNLALPSGVTAQDVVAMRASGGLLMIQTEDGRAFVTGQNANSELSGSFSTTSFNQIAMPSGVTVVEAQIAQSAMLILGSDGNLYRFGTPTAVLLPQPVVSGGIAQIEVGNNGSYLVLDGSGQIHVMGENSAGQLGIGNTTDQTAWSIIPGYTATYIAASGSSNEFGTAALGSGFIDANGQVYLFGNNNANNLTNAAAAVQSTPVLASGVNANAIALEIGGHVTPYIGSDLFIYNTGHNQGGGFGDGTTGDRTSYAGFAINDIVAGTDPVVLALYARRDTDGDGIYDHLDIDKDNDGITDNIEAQATDPYIAPSGVGAAMLDVDGDGLDDNYDANTADATSAASIGLIEVDTDGDGAADTYDTDSDNDGLSDAAENGLGQALQTGISNALTDTDGDGLFDVFETAIDGNANDGFVVNEGVADPLRAEANQNGYLPDDGDAIAGSIVPLSADLNYRDATVDNTAPVGVDDNIPVIEDTPVTQNVLGNDIDGESDPLTIASATIDTDGDGNPDALTLGVATPITDNLGNPIGAITVNANGNVTFTPAPNYTGPVPGLAYVPNDGTVDGAPATVTFGPIAPVNDPPVLDLDNDDSSDATGAGTGANFEYTYIENAAAAPIVDVTGFTLADIDNQIVELVVTLTDGQIGDTIQFPSVMPGGITASVVPAATLVAPGPITLTLTGTGATTLANWQSVLAAITFLPSTNDVHNPDPADRHITVQASDASSGNSNLATATIHVVPENDPPTLDLDDFNTTGLNAGNYQGTYVENAPGAPISDGVVITDLDDTNLEGVTITLTNGEIGDLLAIGALPSGISLVGAPPSPLAAPGTITVQLTGAATLADYQAAIAAIAFSSTSENPAAGIRNIEVTGNDGDADTPTRTAFITVQPVNDAPFPIDPAGDPNTPANAMPPQTGSDAQALAPFDVTPYFNDFDNPVASLTYALDPSAPAWFSIDSNTGIISGTPPSDASQNTNTGTPGSYDVIVIATDPGGLTGQTTVNYAIANPPPVAIDDAFLAFESGGASGNVLAANPATADSDPDGDAISVSAVNGLPGNVGVPTAGSTGGLFFIVSSGGFTFSANGDFEDLAAGETRDTTISYTIDDGQGGTDTATVTVTVVGENDDPVVVGTIPAQTGDDAQNIAPLDVTAAFDDVDASDVLTYSATGLPAGLAISPAGVVTGTIDPSASQNGNTGLPADGVYTVVVTADDGNGGTVDLTFTYAVANPPPLAQDDNFAGDEDTPVVGLDAFADNGGGDDADPDGDAPLAVSEVNGNPVNVGTPTAGDNGGLFTLNADGTLSFDPNGDFEDLAVGESASTAITYQLSDGEGGFSTATVTYTVNGVNDNPVPVIPGDPNPPADPNDYIPVQSGVDNQPVAPLDLTQFFDDPDASDILTIAINPGELPPGLTFDGVTISGTLDPAASQGGDDPLGNPGVYVIPVTVTDGNGGSFTTTLVYDISNPPPVAVDDALTGDEDTATAGDLFAANPAAPDTDPDGDTFVVTRVIGNGNEGDLAVLVDGAGVGVAVAGSAGGTFTVLADGSVAFDPGSDFQDLDVGETRTTQIAYQIDDGEGGTDTATVTYTVVGANDGPVVIDPSDPFPNPNDPPVPGDPDNVIPDQTGNDGQALTPLDASPYFVDVDVEALTFSLGVGAPPWLAIDPLTGEITGTPPSDASQGGPGFDGVYPVTIVATDPDGESASTTVDFSISNLPPIAVDDASIGDEDHDQSGNVLTDALTGDADTAPDSDPLIVTSVAGNPAAPGSPAVMTLTYGMLTLNSDGAWLFEPNAAANQLPATAIVTETVSYIIDDGNGGVDTADLVITISGVNDPVQVVDPNDPATDPTDPSYDPVDPAAIPDPDNLIPDVAYNDGDAIVPIPAGDYFGDAEGDAITFAASDLPPGLSIDPVTGEISGALDHAASQGGNTANPGEYLVTITATDPQGNTAATTVTITTSNLPPIAADDALAADEDTPITGSVMADNGSGPDGDAAPDTDLILVSEVNGNPANVGIPVAGIGGGAFTILADGTYLFDPGTDFQDLDVGETRVTTVAYTISDGNGGTDTATVTVTVTGANDGPVVIDPNDPFPNPNDPPVPGDPDNVVPDQTGNDGQALTPLDVSPYFVDVDVEALTFSLGVGAPSWLAIDPLTGAISGTPPSDASQGGPNGDGVYPVTVVATDPEGEMATTTVDFSISNLPPLARDDAVSAPEDGVSAGDVFADNGNGADADTPPDADPIVVSAVNGLPANVNAPVAGSGGGSFTIHADGTFDFDPGTDFQGLDIGESRITTIAYTISDGNGGTSTATVTMTVVGANDAPVVIDPNDPFPDPNDPPVPGDPDNVIPDVAGQDSVPIVPVDVTPYFHDVDGETLTYSFGPGAPTWLSIDPLTGIVSGTPPSDASQGGPGSDGAYPVTIVATDPDGETASTTLDFAIANIPPVADTAIPPQAETAGYDFELPTAGHFDDPDNDTLTYSATGLPGGLAIDPATGEITGTVSLSAVGDAPQGDGLYMVTVTVDDGQGGTASLTFPFQILPLPFVSDNPPEPPSNPDALPPPEEAIPAINLIVDAAVQEISPLGPLTGLLTRYPVTEAVNGIARLGAGMNFEVSNHPVTQVVEWIGRTRAALAGEYGLGDDGEFGPWFGGDARIAAADGDIVVRTLVWDGVVYVEFLPGSGGWRLAIDGDDRLPGGAERIAANLLAYRPAAGDDRFELLLMRGGESHRFVIDTIGGVIESLPDRLGALNAAPELPAPPTELR